RRRHTRLQGDWSSDVCSSDLLPRVRHQLVRLIARSQRPDGGSTLSRCGTTSPAPPSQAIQRNSCSAFFSARLRSLTSALKLFARSEERRVGKEWRLRWWRGS